MGSRTLDNPHVYVPMNTPSNICMCSHLTNAILLHNIMWNVRYTLARELPQTAMPTHLVWDMIHQAVHIGSDILALVSLVVLPKAGEIVYPRFCLQVETFNRGQVEKECGPFILLTSEFSLAMSSSLGLALDRRVAIQSHEVLEKVESIVL